MSLKQTLQVSCIFSIFMSLWFRYMYPHPFSLYMYFKQEMIRSAHSENTMITWLLRGLGMFINFLGFTCLTSLVRTTGKWYAWRVIILRSILLFKSFSLAFLTAGDFEDLILNSVGLVSHVWRVIVLVKFIVDKFVYQLQYRGVMAPLIIWPL